MSVLPFTPYRHDDPYALAHRHPGGQLFLMQQGTAVLQTGSGPFAVPRGWLGWVPGNMDHAIDCSTAVAGISVTVPPEVAATLCGEPRVAPASTLILDLFRRLARVSEGPRQRNLLAVIQDEMAGHDMGDGRPAQKLRAAIEFDPADPRTLAQWASEFGIAERTLARQVRTETGMSFGAMRRQLRFRHAAELLEAGASVIEAALAVGYQSHSAFTTRFAQAMGCAPSGFADHQDRESRMAESVPPLTDMAG